MPEKHPFKKNQPAFGKKKAMNPQHREKHDSDERVMGYYAADFNSGSNVPGG